MATFNARAETVETKPFFCDAFKRNRCLIPMSGYYEWQDRPAGKRPAGVRCGSDSGQKFRARIDRRLSRLLPELPALPATRRAWHSHHRGRRSAPSASLCPLTLTKY
jgi:SOS response associated peptidase (SRAP)